MLGASPFFVFIIEVAVSSFQYFLLYFLYVFELHMFMNVLKVLTQGRFFVTEDCTVVLLQVAGLAEPRLRSQRGSQQRSQKRSHHRRNSK
jgi:hypothetical protein